MAEYRGNLDGKSNRATLHVPVADGVTVSRGDFVYMTGGRLTSASIAGVALLGMADGTATGNTAGSVTVPVIVDPNAKFLVENDNVGTTFAASHVGTYFDLTGATGAQLLDTSSTGATGQLLVVEYTPESDGAAKAVCVIAESALKL